MRKHYTPFLLLALALGLSACQSVTKNSIETPTVEITVFQLNDVYEMSAVSSGTRGGLSRVATALKEEKARNPNTLSILAGDLFSPSAIGNAEVDGERLAGKQMVDVLNLMGWDYFTIGNHEFDIPEADFRKRLAEAQFTTITDNVFDQEGHPGE